MSGNQRSGSHRSDGYDAADGAAPAGGGYGRVPDSGTEYDPRSGEYRTVSGGYPVPPAEYRPTGQYSVDSGYAAPSGEYGTPSSPSSPSVSGGYGLPSDSGGYGTASGLGAQRGGYGSAGGASTQSGGYGLPSSAGTESSAYGSTSGAYGSTGGASTESGYSPTGGVGIGGYGSTGAASLESGGYGSAGAESGGYRSAGGAGTQSGGYGSAGGASVQSGGYGSAGGASAQSGGYGSTPSGEYGAGRESGGHGATAGGGHPSSTGGYGTRGGSTDTGGYGALGGGRSSTDTGGYGIPSRSAGAQGSGSTQTGGYGIPGRASVQSGEYESGGGEYGTRGGSYGRASRQQQPPPSRRSSGSGGYRSGTGSHRVVREPKPARRFTLVLAGVAAGVGACVLAAFAILNGVGVGEKDAGQVVGSGATNGSPTNKAERAIVPDACEVLGKEVADKLAPNADRTQADNYQSSDRQNQCVWGAYTGENKRQLTVELRAIEGAQSRPPADVAKERFGSERKADESGQALLAGQELTDKQSLDGVGDEGYVVYSVDEGQGSGEAIANVRMVNVLITIHYSGGDDGKPLGASAAMDGATEAAESVAERLNQG